MSDCKIINKLQLFLIFLFALVLLLSGCQKQDAQAEKVETVTYQNVTGYEITVPKDWQLAKQTAEGGAYFLTEDKHISLNIFAEVGGMNYLDPQEISEGIYQKLAAVISGAQVVKVLPVGDSDKEYRQLIEGKDVNGNPVMADIWLIQPMDGMRYYTILCCGGDDYEKNITAYDDCIASFRIYLSQDEIYSLFTLSEDELAQKLTDGMKMAQ